MNVTRPELISIKKWIKPNSRVLDLGCGDCTLLKYLKEELNINEYGLEINDASLTECIKSKINVIQQDLNQGLTYFEDHSFDYVVMTQALQAMKKPDQLLDEMLRVGHKGIITFPNFGHWRSRFQLVFQGRMPVSCSLPFQWYNTPNIHLCTLKDFELLCDKKQIEILERKVVSIHHTSNWSMKLLPNLMGEVALYQFMKKQP